MVMRQPSRGRQKRTRRSTKREKSTPEASTTGVNSNIESMAFEMIKKAGEKGLLQVDLLKKLGTDNRRGSKLISGLEEQGLISKSRELYRGKWTYRLALPASKTPVVTWGDMDCPCFFCNDSGRCGLGNVVSPSSCSDLSGWLKSFIEGENGNQPSTQPA
jgi:hypothetical protein